MARLAQRGDECGLEHAPLSLSSGMKDTSLHRGEREGYGGPRDVTSLSLSLLRLLVARKSKVEEERPMIVDRDGGRSPGELPGEKAVGREDFQMRRLALAIAGGSAH